MFFRLLLFGQLRFDSRYRFCVSYFTYISMEKFVKTLEASVSGAFYSFLIFSLFNRHDA